MIKRCQAFDPGIIKKYQEGFYETENITKSLYDTSRRGIGSQLCTGIGRNDYDGDAGEFDDASAIVNAFETEAPMVLKLIAGI